MHAIAGYSTHELNRLTIMLLGPYSSENWKVISRNRWRFNKLLCNREDTKNLYKQPILRVSSPKYKPSRDDLKREYKRRVSIWFDGVSWGAAMSVFIVTTAFGVPLLVGSAIAWGADAAITSIRVAVK
jgi:hypothetical protein